nr:hypothetical protein GCM10020092_060560 [Actinoplanes digitatis]
MTLEDPLTTLDTLWSVWAEQGRALVDEQWVRPTRLGAWDVRSLYAHAASWPPAFAGLLDQVRHAEPTHATAAALLRDFNTPDGNANRLRDWSAARAREDATKYSTAQLVEQFAGCRTAGDHDRAPAGSCRRGLLRAGRRNTVNLFPVLT